MKYTVLPLALIISMVSVAEDGWVAVGQVPTAQPAVQPAESVFQPPQSVISVPAETSSVPAQISSVQPSSRGANPSLQLELLAMVEAMQQEIAELRGMVEEQNHKVEMLERQQQQRYLDLDQRVSELYKAPKVSNDSAISGSTSLGGQKALQTADDLYSSAMSSIKNKNFASALSQFELLIKTYPEHSLVANAHYWSGEMNLTDGRFEAAIKQFQKVVDGYPKHNKAADSHYKLAVALDRSGKTDQAKDVLNHVISHYKGISDSAVRLAERYLTRLQTNK